jgi:hypothetical protein
MEGRHEPVTASIFSLSQLVSRSKFNVVAYDEIHFFSGELVMIC